MSEVTGNTDPGAEKSSKIADLLFKIMTEISSLKTDMSSMKADMSSMKSETSSLTADMSSLNAKIIPQTQFVHDMMNPVRLVDKSGNVTTTFGRLEVFVNGLWGTVCDDEWGHKHEKQQNDNLATVVCRMIKGGDAGGKVYNTGEHEMQGSAGVLWLEQVGCEGNEPSIFSCSLKYNKQEYGHGVCSHREDVAIQCY